LGRWSTDWPAIYRAFSPTQNPGTLVKIEGDAGDSHRGGRAVWILECLSGFKLVYKPKPLAVDQHFQAMLEWLNCHGLAAPFRSLQILDRGSYGWEEFLAPQECRTQEEIVRFYERSGGYLALLYGLAATDFHHQNVLAVGEHPILIDLEGLFHTAGLEAASAEATEVAGQTFAESVLGSGLLPIPTWNERKNGAFDLSGLGAEVDQQLPFRVPDWRELGTDQMQFVRRLEVGASTAHRPTLNGLATNPLDYLDAMEKGFQQVYRLLEGHREELMASGGLLDRF